MAGCIGKKAAMVTLSFLLNEQLLHTCYVLGLCFKEEKGMMNKAWSLTSLRVDILGHMDT